jgi:hypothetical protein
MNVHAAAAAPQTANSAGSGEPSGCFCSTTLWHFGGFYLEVNYGYFDTWQDAEAFSCTEGLRLAEHLGAVFITAGGREFFVPDAALMIFQTTSDAQFRTTRMDVDELLELVNLEDMAFVGYGHAVVERGKPIQVRPFSNQPASNDDY